MTNEKEPTVWRDACVHGAPNVRLECGAVAVALAPCGSSTLLLVAERKGLIPLYAAVSSDDEWDDFEWAHRRRYEERARLGPSTTQTQKDLEQSRRWRDGYLRWGRSTMGFGVYVFRNP